LQIVPVILVVEVRGVDQILPSGSHGLSESKFVRIADAWERVQQYVSIQLNTVVFTAMPRPSVRTGTALSPVSFLDFLFTRKSFQ